MGGFLQLGDEQLQFALLPGQLGDLVAQAGVAILHLLDAHLVGEDADRQHKKDEQDELDKSGPDPSPVPTFGIIKA